MKKEISDSKLQKLLILVPTVAFTVKLIIMFNTTGGGWFGADGENYLAGVNALANQGFFSDEFKLTYWPAGYPILLWPIAEIFGSNFSLAVSLIQSLLFAYSTYFFTSKLNSSSIKFLALGTSLLISFNPTLALSSLVLGYETPVASCFMLAAGHMWASFKVKLEAKFWAQTAQIGIWLSLATFMQPRFLLIAFSMLLFWVFKETDSKRRIQMAGAVSIIVLIAPSVLMVRNNVVTGSPNISTNLSAALLLGAGPETSGGFLRSGPEVECGADADTENEKVFCALHWYLSNPGDTIRLSFNKAFFYWSPWSGPEAEGTMARNPWLKISPAEQISLGSTSGDRLVYGYFGILVSWMWILAQILFVFLGYRILSRVGPEGDFFAKLLLIPIILPWLISIATIGDHRFRIPTMSLSLVLQLSALLWFRDQIKSKFDKI